MHNVKWIRKPPICSFGLSGITSPLELCAIKEYNATHGNKKNYVHQRTGKGKRVQDFKKRVGGNGQRKELPFLLILEQDLDSQGHSLYKKNGSFSIPNYANTRYGHQCCY